jgi:formylglycine-generating enzyme required for sulfatase activity
MGSEEYSSEKPIHQVTISSFMMGKTPVTNKQYRMFIKDTGYHEPISWCHQEFSSPHQPVVEVNWNDAVAFCEWLSKKSKLNYDLPTEAQWEYAARGTDGREFPWGNERPNDTRASFVEFNRASRTVPVGSFPDGMGPFGTLDQAGNVWEWCKDVWDEYAYYDRDKKEVTDPIIEGSDEHRSIRGGCFLSYEVSIRCAARAKEQATGRDRYCGFRVVLIPQSNINNDKLCPKGCGVEGDNIAGTLKCPICWHTW